MQKGQADQAPQPISQLAQAHMLLLSRKTSDSDEEPSLAMAYFMLALELSFRNGKVEEQAQEIQQIGIGNNEQLIKIF